MLPGSYHPILHRPKVGVGQSHFAYGIAAFSDYCGKKRTDVECIHETLNWVKFIQTAIPPIQTLKEAVENLPDIHLPKQKQGGKASSATSSGGFQPLINEIKSSTDKILAPLVAYKSRFRLIEKSLGGGWKKESVHIISGSRESGKATFLQNLAMSLISSNQIMFISFEHSMREFLIRSSSYISRISRVDLLNQISQPGAIGEKARQTLGKMVSVLIPKLGENFYFRGAESSIREIDIEDIQQLFGMMPENDNRILFLESVTEEMLTGLLLDDLRKMCLSDNITVFISLHSDCKNNENPNVIGISDIQLLNKYQKHCESILLLDTKKAHLRKFVGMIKGQIDPQFIAKLEQKALQMANNKRLASDAYSLCRVIHTRSGKREMILMLYQPDLLSFFELINSPINKA